MLLEVLFATMPKDSPFVGFNKLFERLHMLLLLFKCRFSRLTFNFLLSNGQALWAHASTDLHYVLRQYPFKTATLKDDDMQVNFADQTNPGDRVAVVVTAPLTLDEPWTAVVPGEVLVFRDGVLL